MNKKMIAVSALCFVFFISTVTFWMAYSNADEERDQFRSEVQDLESELDMTESTLQQTKNTLNTSMQNVEEINSSFQEFKDRAYVVTVINTYYESTSYDNVVSVTVANMGEGQVSDATGICGIYEESTDEEASDAFYIDLEGIASEQRESRSYGFSSDEYDVDFSSDTVIQCHTYSADGGIPASMSIGSWNENVENWEEMATSGTTAEEV